MKRHTTPGFTIIELLVAIAVIATVLIITTALYTSTQAKARDTQLRDTADKVADAVQLFIAKNGHFPKGGIGSTAAIGAGQECTNGSNGFYTSGQYTCTVEDTLIASGYLPSGFSTGLPPNTTTNQPNQSIMVYTMSAGYAMVFYSMEAPSGSDTTNFQAQLNKCGVSGSPSSTSQYTSGMRNGMCFPYTP